MVKRKIFILTLIISLSLIYLSLAFTVNDSPIKVEILQDGKINFFYNNVDEIFQDDCIISIKYFLDKNEGYGHRISSLEQNLGNSYEVLERNNESITLKAGNLTINQKVTYINGTDFFTIEWNITNIANKSIKNISFFHGADMAVAGTDFYDYGVYNSNNKALYAKDSGYVVGLVPLPDFIPDEFDIDKYSNVWNHIIEGKLYNKTSYWGDPAIAFWWRKEELKANKIWIIKVNWKFNEDNEIPEINYSVNPKINFVNESFSIQANASEFVFWQIKIFNESGVLFYYNSSGNSTSLNWNYSEIGNFTIEIAATDNAGNTKIVNDSIKIIQRQQLFLNVTKPLNNSITNNRTIIVEGFTNALNVSINGFIANVSNGNFSFALNLTEGNNTINVTARDYLGNENSTTLKAILDTSIPLFIIEPLNNTTTNNRTILIKGITKANGNVTNGNFTTNTTTGNFSFYLNLSEGNNILNITARDSLGNVNSTTLKVILDTKIPLTILEPLNNTLTNNKTILIRGITKANGNLSVNENFTTNTTTGNFSFYLNLTEGNNILNITARDYLGNTNSTTLSVILDTEAPKIIWINYSSTIRIYKTFRFALNITDNVNLTYASAKMMLDDITENLFIYFVDGYYIVNVEPTRTGDWILNIKACDSVGNCNESSFGFYAYRETSEDTTTKGPSTTPTTQPQVQPAIQNTTNETNETNIIEDSLKIIDDESNTIGVVTFNITKDKYFDAAHLRFVNGTIFYESESYEKRLFNGRGVIVFWNNNTGDWTKDKNRLEVSNGKVGEDINEILERVSNERKEEIERYKSVEIIEPLINQSEEKVKIEILEDITKDKIFETEVRDKEGNLIKDKYIEITLPNGEKIKVKTDEKGKVKLMSKDGKIEQMKEIKLKIPENLEERKVFELEIRDENGELLKNKTVSIKLPNGQSLIVETDENGKVKLQYKRGSFAAIETQKQEFEFRWYYLLPLFLIPLLLYLVLKEDVILSYEFYKKLKKEKKLREIEKYGKKYMLKKYSGEVNDIKVIFVDSESEEDVAKKLKLRILK
ncbi:exported hypothetical protein [groundwater metagenome]|uniref:Bacterial Ig-like domain-containing protein n=1 Tax=groundwater metagenome TaxID=717931 RepID=A0A098EBY2_9ZZZZ